MANKQIEIFEHDYDQLMIRAGHPDKIKYVVKHLMALISPPLPWGEDVGELYS